MFDQIEFSNVSIKCMREISIVHFPSFWVPKMYHFEALQILRGASVEIARGGGGDAQWIGLYEGCMRDAYGHMGDIRGTYA